MTQAPRGPSSGPTRASAGPLAVPMAPKDAEFEAMFDLFYPRYHWTTPSFWTCSESERMRTIFLLALLQRGLIARVRERAAIADCEGRYRTRPDWSEAKSQSFRQCAFRKGNDDLKSQSWSAYLEMQRRDPEGRVVILNSPCFLVYAERERSVIVPGNGSPVHLTRFVAGQRIQALFFVSGVEDQASDKECEFWRLEGLRFSEESLSLLNEHDAQDYAVPRW